MQTPRKMNSIKPHKGSILIADPSILSDTSFNRSIILLAEHSINSSIGFIMNKPLNFTLKDLIPNCNGDYVIYQGGPVEQNNLYFIHKIPHLLPNSIEVGNGIYWGGDFDQLTKVLDTGIVLENDIRFFLGYCGWHHNQLINEIDCDSWFVKDNITENILEIDTQSFWKNEILFLGGKYKIWANAPNDPNLN